MLGRESRDVLRDMLTMGSRPAADGDQVGRYLGAALYGGERRIEPPAERPDRRPADPVPADQDRRRANSRSAGYEPDPVRNEPGRRNRRWRFGRRTGNR